MGAMVKSIFGGTVKQLTCCLPTDLPKEKLKSCEEEGMVARMRRKWGSEEQYRQSLEEEKRKRDAVYAQKKAERAVMRDHFREKYHLPKNQADEQQRHAAVSSNMKLSKDVTALVKPEEPADTELSYFRALPSFQNLDLSFLQKTAQSTMNSLKPGAQCQIM
ncbi:complexin-3-like [Ambystoma mexicanum]|uniref:complexin-3-like n=1 Tax=Ambystoma mexicanum TaxID=8296 RepID=UPI0037E9C4A7